MAQVSIQIAGRGYILACKEGGEAHIEQLAANIDAKAEHLLEQLGPMNEPRLLLMAALMLADELHELKLKADPAASPPALSPALTETLATLTERAESLVRRLEAPLRAI